MVAFRGSVITSALHLINYVVVSYFLPVCEPINNKLRHLRCVVLIQMFLSTRERAYTIHCSLVNLAIGKVIVINQ